MPKEKERVDVLLVRQGLMPSREKAQAAIMAGLVFRENQRVDKAGEKVPVTTVLEIKGEPLPYVGRGGLKLEKALQVFEFHVENKVMLDIGSSTGGFTDCALQNGAKLVYALDVGYNQLAWKLRNDSRVIVMERTNFRYSRPEDFVQGQPDCATIDVSFISLTKILPVLRTILLPKGEAIALIKPQFEAGRDEVGKKGIVREPKIHERVLNETMVFASQVGFDVLSLSFSPITGGEGNIEFLAHLRRSEGESGQISETIDAMQTVKEAHQQLK